MCVTARAALKLVPERLETQPVFLCIDDTMVPKFGKKFEDVSKLFDHAALDSLFSEFTTLQYQNKAMRQELEAFRNGERYKSCRQTTIR